ncbi:response regulator [Geomonas sp.]|uniref:ATP-binding response regulator n=1 Tax=Geomonas sp. TaxID=2651584 RepID=UPI002B45EE75|nr:response regulator [Geomonas sp.]HJV36016.1 response regulator [Geomonas sp.]
MLIIDDDPNNLAIMSEFLQECCYTILVAEDGESGLQRAAYARPDLILLDVMMPGMDGYETCRRLKAQDGTSEIPVICMTALAETGNKLQGFRAGAVDYITKPYQRDEVLARVDLHLRLRKATRELKDARDLLEVRVEERTRELEALNRKLEREVAEHRRTGEALRGSERRFQAIFDNAFQLMGLMTPEGIILAGNRTAIDFSGREEEEVVGSLLWDAPWLSEDPKLQQQVKEAVAKAAAGSFVRFEVTRRYPDGTPRHIDFSIKPVQDETGRVVLLIPEGRDITDNRNLAEQLRQSQKMEAIGTLAGGIAHDFNNILTAIMGFGSLLGMKMEEDSPLMEYLNEILSASERAANLTNSLLAFSRIEAVEPGPVQLNETVRKIEKFLLRIIGEDIELTTELAPQELVISSNRGHLEQILMNLATNARDAMADGGSLVIKTERVEISEPLPGFELEAGSYAVLSVSDSGEGMPESVRQRIFEPFFTTKEVGRGTGLGLAIVYGIIQQHNGQIQVCSEPGMGTTFKIFLRMAAPEVRRGDAPRSMPVVGGRETILLAEDDSEVKRFLTRTLSEQGYTVIESADGEEAVREFQAHEDEIDLLILDVVMPRMNGKEAYQQICQSHRRVPVIYSSGYTADIISQKGILEEGALFISKPMTPRDLLSKVRAALS